MALTTQQLQQLKAAIEADPALAAIPNTPDGAFAVAAELNKPAAPAFIVWRGNMPVSEIEQNGFAWSQLDSVPAAKYRIWERLTSSGFINPSKPNVRQGISDFCRDQSDAVLTTLRDSILPHLKRQATRAEALFATGTGTDVNPGTLVIEGALRYQDVLDARAQ